MKYLIDLTDLRPNTTGIELVAEQATLALISEYRENEYILVFFRYIPEVFRRLEGNPNIKIITLKAKHSKIMRLITLPRLIRRQKADFNLFFSSPAPFFTGRAKCVCEIHDLTAFKYPETMEKYGVLRWRKLIKHAVRHGSHIITPTDTVKNEILEKFGRGDTKRIYNGISAAKFDGKVTEEKENFILSVSTLEPRKNISLLIKAFCDLTREGKINSRLVLVGRTGWKLDTAIGEKAAEEFKDKIVFTGYIPDEELKSLYKKTALFVLPSKYEGFGLPVIEALKNGAPTLVSNIPVFREIAGKYADYFISGDIEDLKQKLVLCLSGKGDAQKCPTDAFSEYSWKNYARELNTYLSGEKEVLFIHQIDLNSGCGGARRREQNRIGCESVGACDEYVPYFFKKTMFNFFNSIFFGLTLIKRRDVKNILRLMSLHNYRTVFLDSSVYGSLAKKIKKKFPSVRVIAHYHNFEKIYWQDWSSASGSPARKFIKGFVARTAINNEKLSSRESDVCAFISEEDRDSVCREYGIGPEKAVVIPPCLEDKFDPAELSVKKESYVLFLGLNFFANEEAARFLIDEVAPKIKMKVCIVGSGMKTSFPDTYENVEVYDFIPSLSEMMGGAAAFVSPIFHGSGAKIKVAEALMHGKYIIGTKGSFAGYDVSHASASVCETAEEFISAINSLDTEKRFYEDNRALFLSKYSMKNNAGYYEFLGEVKK